MQGLYTKLRHEPLALVFPTLHCVELRIERQVQEAVAVVVHTVAKGAGVGQQPGAPLVVELVSQVEVQFGAAKVVDVGVGVQLLAAIGRL